MSIEYETVQKPIYVCDRCKIKFKTKKAYAKHIEKCNHIFDDCKEFIEKEKKYIGKTFVSMSSAGNPLTGTLNKYIYIDKVIDVVQDIVTYPITKPVGYDIVLHICLNINDDRIYITYDSKYRHNCFNVYSDAYDFYCTFMDEHSNMISDEDAKELFSLPFNFTDDKSEFVLKACEIAERYHIKKE